MSGSGEFLLAWDFQKRKQIWTSGSYGTVPCLALIPESEIYVIDSIGGLITVCEIQTGRPIHNF